MIRPHAYQYTSSASTTENRACHGLQTEKRHSVAVEKDNARTNDDVQSTVFMPSPSTPSKPMIIPTRTGRNSKKAPRHHNEDEKGKGRVSLSDHTSSLQSPSLAAFLAMTAIPAQGKGMSISPQKARDRGSSSVKRQNRRLRRSMSSSVPQTWDLLLSPPEADGFGSASYETDVTLGSKSISTESMPSLAEDEDSISSSGTPATPSFGDIGRSDKRSRSLSASVGEDCVLDHPLMQASKLQDVSSETEEDAVSVRCPDAPPRSRTNFKSNLTASFRAIRSAARSISDLASPVRDDHLSQSILSLDVPFTSERRPLAFSELPDPAVRRYFNPIKLSPSELHFQDNAEHFTCKSAVQMQSYCPGARCSANASSPPIFAAKKPKKEGLHLTKGALDTEDPLICSLLPKQREPRENSDFLRVIVLEMNMRKVGKLSDITQGRARLVLPARQIPKNSSEGDEEKKHEKNSGGGRSGNTPRRWVAEEP